ncbi:MAG: OsmC family protein [Nitrososphaerota archaeon]|nr:OsmC family protein [Nitrososphaerota archaeon]
MPTVSSEWKKTGREVRVSVRSFEVVVDHPPEQRGTDLGPTPTELLLSSLAGCYSGTMQAIARAMSIPIESVRITADGVKGEKEYESLRSITLKVEITPKVESTERLRLLLDQTKRNCTVSNTLTHPPTITIEPAP